MSKSSFGLAVTLPVVLLALLSAPWASAGDRSPAAAREPHRLGDHPAVVVQRLQKTAGYDYAARFYPHPAWLYLSSQPPRDDDGMAAAAASGGASTDLKLVRAGDGR